MLPSCCICIESPHHGVERHDDKSKRTSKSWDLLFAILLNFHNCQIGCLLFVIQSTNVWPLMRHQICCKTELTSLRHFWTNVKCAGRKYNLRSLWSQLNHKITQCYKSKQLVFCIARMLASRSNFQQWMYFEVCRSSSLFLYSVERYFCASQSNNVVFGWFLSVTAIDGDFTL